MSPFIEAARLTLLNGGGTFNLVGEEVTHETGYYVGGFLPTIEVPASSPSEELAELLGMVAQQIYAEDDLDCYIGTWVHEGIIYLDATMWIANLTIARLTAQYNGELAIWDIANASAIELPTTQG